MDKLSLCLVVICAVAQLNQAYNFRPRSEDSEERHESRDLDLDCKEMFEECKGVPKCCGDTQCYFSGGYTSLGQTGFCVECVDRSQECQRDSQCCDPLQCDKSSFTDMNGVCEVKKAAGVTCYRDGQCESDECDKKWPWSSDGKCE